MRNWPAFGPNPPPDLFGDPDPDILLTCWGTTLGAALEAASVLRQSGTSCAVLHFSQVSPLAPDHFLPLLQKTSRPVMIEGNSTGQLARLIRQETALPFLITFFATTACRSRPDTFLIDCNPFTAQ